MSNATSILNGEKQKFIKTYTDNGFNLSYAEVQWTVQGQPETIAYKAGYRVGNFSEIEYTNPFDCRNDYKEWQAWNDGYTHGRNGTPTE